ncbi:hypothetical protein GGX14DRAFT_596838 [Mycena pura]|uniref:DUF6589 domain-containing protein n=1 Tax=Mycena pura TaxID=153505 RepID=A0AAD6UWJ8_9AGAR|nr:hypothetical protein GGX14DRAFT_596838 [Mycena pura]
MLWDGNVPKKVIRTLNRYGFCTSNQYSQIAVQYISKDAVRLARTVANDPEKLIMLPNDNFNWVGKTWEASATHANVMHDQVSAILIVLDVPEGLSAEELGSQENFAHTFDTRHKIPAYQALEEIMPSVADQHTFEINAAVHVAQILGEEIRTLGKHSHLLQIEPTFELPSKQTEEYYLPTYDQEQTSTRGNMLVMEHYFRDGGLNTKSVL